MMSTTDESTSTRKGRARDGMQRNATNFCVEGETFVTFNVGGFRFETLESSLFSPKHCVQKLKDEAFLKRHWDEARNQYFFDRDPVGFRVVLNYMRTGLLHLPNNLCSPKITAELQYWGLPRIDIEPCCRKDYSIGLQSLENLRKLEHDRQPAYIQDDMPRPILTTPFNRSKMAVWDALSDPSSSKLAKFYAALSLTCVVTSIFSFVMVTVPATGQSHDDGELYILNETVFRYIDNACFAFFVIDNFLKVFSTSNHKQLFKSVGFIVDLIALTPDVTNLISSIITPFTSSESQQIDEIVEILELCKFMRLFRVFRLIRRLTGVMVIFYTLWASIKEMLSLVVILLVSVLVFASFVFFTERGQKDFTSVFDGCWWSLITMTTVGYNAVPTSMEGRIIGSLCAVWGVLLLGITIPTMVSNFVTYDFLIRYINEREIIYLYRRLGNFEVLPDIPFPDFL